MELQTVTQRPKLKKYFPSLKVDELIQFLMVVGQKIEAEERNNISRDPKDNFLLDIIDSSNPDYLITGDKDLLVLNPFKNTRILTPADFEAIYR